MHTHTITHSTPQVAALQDEIAQAGGEPLRKQKARWGLGPRGRGGGGAAVISPVPSLGFDAIIWANSTQLVFLKTKTRVEALTSQIDEYNHTITKTQVSIASTEKVNLPSVSWVQLTIFCFIT